MMAPLETLDIGLRLTSAALVGMLVGLNRDLEGKQLGARTLGLVALGAALACLATTTLPIFHGHPDAQSRVTQGLIQGILTGIGFIGAGVILRNPQERRVRGLTTAATVWVTAALGIACAVAAWEIVLIGVALTMFILLLARTLEEVVERRTGIYVRRRDRPDDPEDDLAKR